MGKDYAAPDPLYQLYGAPETGTRQSGMVSYESEGRSEMINPYTGALEPTENVKKYYKEAANDTLMSENSAPETSLLWKGTAEAARKEDQEERRRIAVEGGAEDNDKAGLNDTDKLDLKDWALGAEMGTIKRKKKATTTGSSSSKSLLSMGSSGERKSLLGA